MTTYRLIMDGSIPPRLAPLVKADPALAGLRWAWLQRESDGLEAEALLLREEIQPTIDLSTIPAKRILRRPQP